MWVVFWGEEEKIEQIMMMMMMMVVVVVVMMMMMVKKHRRAWKHETSLKLYCIDTDHRPADHNNANK